MKDLLKVKKGITHAGKFHTDDVLSTVLIQEFNPNIEIIRVEEYEVDDLNEEELAFDIGLGEFDHHDKNREINDFGYPYSAFGKLWRVYGREYLKMYGFKNIEIAFDNFNKLYVSKVDQGDNTGYKNVEPRFFENELISKFNPSWFEKKNNSTASDNQFFKAVEFARLLFSNWMRQLYEQIELNDIEQDIWDTAVDNEEDGIIVLEERIPWQTFIKKDKKANVKLIISKNDRGGYSVTSKDSGLFKIKESKYLSFVHPSQFMGVADSLENAIMGARYSLNPIFS